MNRQPGNFELLEPSLPEALVPDSWVEPWMIALVLLFVVMSLAVLILKKKKARPADPRSIEGAAHAEAFAALQKIETPHPRDVAVHASLILRNYLSVCARDPALFETHEETISRHEALKDFSEDARQAAGHGLARLAALKYASGTGDISKDAVVTESLQLLKNLHHGFRG